MFEQLKIIWQIENIGSFLTVLMGIEFVLFVRVTFPNQALTVRRKREAPITLQGDRQGRGLPCPLVKGTLPTDKAEGQ